MTIQNVTASHAPRAHFHPKPDGAADPAGEAGWYLQREREMRGLSLEKAGQDTGVHPHHLEAIEAGDLTRLPERAQALNMIGTYARYLGFDPQPLIAHFGRLIPKAGQETAGGGKKPFSSAKILSFPLIERLRPMTSGAGGVAASVLAAILLFGGAIWAIAPGAGDGGATVDIVAQNAPADPAGPEKGVRTVASISKAAEKSLDDAAPAPAPGSIEALIARTVPDVTARKDAKPLATPKEAAGKGFVLRARGDVWVRIEDKKGDTLYSSVMQKGETYTVPAREGLSIIARDGALLEWMLDGKVMGRLSAPGKVLMGKPLDPETLPRQKS